ncbi:methyltransferase domain-containing protein [Labedella phragmitis]|uniref:Methyltransferase domain-containing protein n=2 Tax=Labedella phragmitis TaxID=2498849 RepID=A0A444PTN7_9MICO|nr:methyltransferase domain-containing protein [Labedella phragmitis]
MDPASRSAGARGGPRDRPSLRERAADLTELMDDPQCDPVALDRTYARFGLVNRLVSGWRGVYRTRIRPLARHVRSSTGSPLSILDIGFGGGDLPLALAHWARKDGIDLTITGIDPDERAFAFASRRRVPPGVAFRREGSADLVSRGERYDLVISNHVLHHLDSSALDNVLHDSAVLARHLVIHNDIERGRIAYAGYQVGITPIAPGSFLRTDGLRSIRRSYTAPELARVVPTGWRVEQHAPFRVLAVFDAHPTEATPSSPGRTPA